MRGSRMHAFPKSARLRQSHEFRTTFDKGVKTVCPQVVLFARPRSGESPSAVSTRSRTRLGLVVSRKVGESVTRNRVKRHLREAFRHLRPELDQSEDFGQVDLVVVARPSIAKASSEEIATGLKHCLKRLRRQLRQRTDSHAQSQ